MTRDIQPNSETEFEEPVFKTDEPETVFAEQDSYAADDSVSAEPESSPTDQSLYPETDQTATASDSGEDEYYGFEGTSAEGVPRSSSRRQLGRTGPFWTLGGVGLLVITGLVVWLLIFRDSSQSLVEATPQPTVPSPVATQVEATPTSEPAPTPTSAPVELPIGANVVVAEAEGIRLRNGPGLESNTLIVIEDGTPFIVLGTDGEQENYPVEADGFLWYRVRATTGEEQEGWAASAFFVISE